MVIHQQGMQCKSQGNMGKYIISSPSSLALDPWTKYYWHLWSAFFFSFAKSKVGLYWWALSLGNTVAKMFLPQVVIVEKQNMTSFRWAHVSCGWSLLFHLPRDAILSFRAVFLLFSRSRSAMMFSNLQFSCSCMLPSSWLENKRQPKQSWANYWMDPFRRKNAYVKISNPASSISQFHNHA